MSVELYTNPFLLDFVKVALALPEDERKQIETVSGEPYDVDGVAVGNYSAPGPKWVLKVDDEPIVIGGFVPQRKGVWRDFLMTTPTAWQKYWFRVTRSCIHAMNAALYSGQAHRLECVVPAARVAGRPELARWYKTIGYNEEGTLHGYYVDGSDAVILSRVRH